MKKIALFCVLLCASPMTASGADDWVESSDANAQLLLDLFARFAPEQAGSLGVDGLDEEIFDLRPKLHQRTQEATTEVIAALERRLAKESDPLVREDLQILIKSARDSHTTAELQHKLQLPYYNLTQTVFQGVRSLIDAQIPAERYPAVVERLRKYAGITRGFAPIAKLARDRTSERFDVDGLIGPYRGEVEQDLERAPTFIDGMRELLEGASVEGWEQPFETLAQQLTDYNDWLRREVLPRARTDFRLPPELYADALKNWGVDADPHALIKQATQGYIEIRNEMMALAPLVAKQKDYDVTDYRDVIARLKQEQIAGDELLQYYYARLRDLEDIIKERDLVSLPDRDAGIRIASAAETAASPAAHLDIPRLIGNTGEFPEFVLPKLEKDDDGNWIGSDDTYKAGTWTLTAHEARPGHELQFSSMLEGDVSIARGIFAFNSANVEGWALYAEAIVKPYMPLDGQLIGLQYRLARAARMFLDPMLNLGLIEPEQAKQLLLEDVVLGETWAQNEIERYTYRIPGQATAYYYGYLNLQSLRARTELALREDFDARAYHDFILAQGLLPPNLLEKAIMERFVPSQRNNRMAAD